MGHALGGGSGGETPPARPARSTARRLEIIDVAARLFERHGYRGTSMDDIAAEFGFTKAALYYYFPSKAALLEAICESTGDEFMAGVAPRPDVAPARRLIETASHHVSVVVNRRAVFSVSTLERPELGERGRTKLADGEREYLQRVAALIGELPTRCSGGANGEIVAAHALVGLLNSPAEWYRPGPMTPTEVGASLAGLFLWGVAAPEAAAVPGTADGWPRSPVSLGLPVRSGPPQDGKSPRGRWEELVSVALEVFHERGYRRTTLQHLADALGVTKPAMYYYVDSKADLLDAVVTRAADPLLEGLAAIAASSDDARDRLRRQIHFVIELLQHQRAAFWVFLHSGAFLDDRVGQRLADYDQRFVKALCDSLAAGGSQGAFRSDVPSVVFGRGLAGMLKATVRWFRPTRSFPAPALAEALWELTLSGYYQAVDAVVELADPATVTSGPPAAALGRAGACDPTSPAAPSLRGG